MAKVITNGILIKKIKKKGSAKKSPNKKENIKTYRGQGR